MNNPKPKPTPTPRRPRVYGMLRTSCDRSDVERQTIDLDDLREENDLDIFETVKLEGVSGTATLDEAQVQEILDKMNRPDNDGLALSALDRLFRMGDDYGTMRILDPFRRYHKTIWSAREGVIQPWTDEGYDKCMTAAARSGSERREIRRRTMKGKLKTIREKGAMVGLCPPFGYRYSSTGRKSGQWVIHEPEAVIVRLMFRMAAEGQGKSGYAIADWLNANGYRTNRGNQWHGRVVRKVLHNRAYLGIALYTHNACERDRDRKNGVHTEVIEEKLAVPAILTGEQAAWFDQAQVQLARRVKEKDGRPSLENYLAQGRLYCARCGSKMTGRRRTKKHRIYHCNAIDYFTHQRKCAAPQVQSGLLDDSLWNGILDRVGDPDEVEARIQRFSEQQAKTTPMLRPSPAERLEKLKRQIAAAERILRDAEISDMWDQAKKDKLDAQAEIAVIERAQASAKTVFHRPPRLSVEQFCAEVRAARGWTEHKDKRGLIEKMVVRIEYADGEWTAEIRMPYTANAAKSGGQKWDRGVSPEPIFAPFQIKGKIAA